MKNASTTDQSSKGVELSHSNYSTEADRLRDALRFCNSYSRLPSMLSLYPSSHQSAWFEVLGEEWSCCDNVGNYRNELGEIFITATRSDFELMMVDDERQTFGTLPDEIIVYRGCYPINIDGLSWSLSKDVAARFPKMARYQRADSQPLLLTGKILKSDCILKLDRREQEIVSCKVRLVNMEIFP
jgi:hypothetical protein